MWTPVIRSIKIRARCRVIVRNNSDKAGSKMTLVGEGLGPGTRSRGARGRPGWEAEIEGWTDLGARDPAFGPSLGRPHTGRDRTCPG